MDRDDLLREVLQIENKNIILELSTGTGKCKLALELADREQVNKILIVIPKLVLINNWIDEIHKFNFDHLIDKIEFVTYISLPKKILNKYDIVIYDEAHHITERCFRAIYMSKNRLQSRNILLSATIKNVLMSRLLRTFPNTYLYSFKLREAIDNEILPDPVVLLYPLYLDNSIVNKIYIKKKSGKPTLCTYRGRWSVMKKPDLQANIKCTEKEYYMLLDEDIKYFSQFEKYKHIYRQKLIQRLKDLSNFKTEKVKHLLELLKDYRTITFCNSIEQTEILGKNYIHSKNSDSEEVLKLFNEKKIKHITACSILNEGVNISDCRIGIFAVITSSDIASIQKQGRLLRHKRPVIIIPYYKNTREEEIVVEKMLPNYNPDLVHTITGLNEIFKYLKE